MYEVILNQVTAMTSRTQYTFQSKKECQEWLEYYESQYPFVLECVSEITKYNKKSYRNAYYDFFN